MSNPDDALDQSGQQTASASRRNVLAAVGAAGVTAALAACQSPGQQVANKPIRSEDLDVGGAGADEPTDEAEEDRDRNADEDERSRDDEESGDGDEDSGDGDGDGGGRRRNRGEVVATLGDIPVGGGAIFAAQGVVITCPDEGEIKAFSVTCPHQGCAVNSVSRGTINCPCHGAKFDIKDGSVTDGPAPNGLEEIDVEIDGDDIILT